MLDRDRPRDPLRGHFRLEWPRAVAASGDTGHCRSLQPDLGVAAKKCFVNTYLQLATLFGTLSLLSIGGGEGGLPEKHFYWVLGGKQLAAPQFARIFFSSPTAARPRT